MHVNEIAQNILYKSFTKQQQNHLYILVANNLEQQQQLYKWYIKLHVCNNQEGKTVCDDCQYCIQVNHDNYINNIVIQKQPDKKSIGVAEIAELQEVFTTTAQLDSERFFCVEYADTLTVQAANSILKFLEEPTGKTIGFLFVKNEQKLLPTIRSRGQIIRLIDEVDQKQIDRVAQKIADPTLQKCANYLLQVGYDEKVVLKQCEPFYTKISSYLTKIANGSPFIVAQTDLEDIAQKTKTSTMILELCMYILDEELKYGTLLQALPTHVTQFVTEHGKELYIALYHTLQKNRYHMSVAMLMTSMSLELEQLIKRP